MLLYSFRIQPFRNDKHRTVIREKLFFRTRQINKHFSTRCSFIAGWGRAIKLSGKNNIKEHAVNYPHFHPFFSSWPHFKRSRHFWLTVKISFFSRGKKKKINKTAPFSNFEDPPPPSFLF